MDPVSSADVFLFEKFRFDRRSGGLFDMDGTQVAVGSRALDVLGVLIERAGELVSKDEIMDVVWPGTTVEEANLTVQISALRRVLDNRGSERSTIQTVAGRGYRFVAAITRHNEASSFDSKALPQHGSRVPPRLSIVVLPIINLSRDAEQEYFADALTDSLTTDLSRLAGSFVISCNTAFTYKGRKVSARQIGSEVGVRYVLEGSVQRSGKQVRINAQLIDAETDGHVWAERFERETGDLFALQEEITRRIAVTLNIALVGAEAARPTEHPVALDYILRGRAATMTPASRENRTEAIGLFEQALALDPRSVAAQSYLATALSARILDHLTDTAAADIERATGLAGQALAASPRIPLAHYANGQVLRAQNRYAEAIGEYETAIAFDRNWVRAYALIAWCKLYTGPIEEAILLVEQAIRLSPRDPVIGIWYMLIGQAHLLQSRSDEAVIWLEKARSAIPAQPGVRALLACAYALKGQTEPAAVELAEARRLSLDGGYSSVARMKATGYYGVPKIRALYEATYFQGLRLAGMPEE